MFAKAARNARAIGFDTICPKRADGRIKWYQSAGHLALERQACLSEGVGYIPFVYSYGPRFGNDQIQEEVKVAAEIASVCDGLVVLDMEHEWNGKVDAARFMAPLLHDLSGDVVVSTWADPVQQDWTGVIQALAPVISAWSPQEYTGWLSLQEEQFTSNGIDLMHLFPALDVSGEFVGTDPLKQIQAAVRDGHLSYWIWEYQYVLANAELCRAILALAGAVIPDFKPVQLPHPTTPPTKQIKWGQYTVQAGDSLSSIASALHITNWYQNLFLPNKAMLDSSARSHGSADSQQGNLVFPGEVLQYAMI